jgi:hypothetical protein
MICHSATTEIITQIAENDGALVAVRIRTWLSFFRKRRENHFFYLFANQSR